MRGRRERFWDEFVRWEDAQRLAVAALRRRRQERERVRLGAVVGVGEDGGVAPVGRRRRGPDEARIVARLVAGAVAGVAALVFVDGDCCGVGGRVVAGDCLLLRDDHVSDGLLRGDERVEDHREEEVNDEEAADDRRDDKVDPSIKAATLHQRVHGHRPSVEGDHHHDLQDGPRHRVEAEEAARVLLEKGAGAPVLAVPGRVAAENLRVLSAAIVAASAALEQTTNDGRSVLTGAAVVKLALEDLDARDAKDDEHQAEQRERVTKRWQRRQDRLDKHRHSGHALEHAQLTKRAKRSDDGEVRRGREDDRDPRRDHDDEIEAAPVVSEVRGLVDQQPVRRHLDQHLESEKDDEYPLENV
mmetsp:Transcript_34150/g.74993  ORF Transcript_34150/g.74993 Transcript_34150/m.74993 type:complete len:358 (+) Transcript_34150:672-1745(+)